MPLIAVIFNVNILADTPELDPGWISVLADVQQITLKVTRGCNLTCSYCNVSATAATASKLQAETFEYLVECSARHSKHATIGFEFHGGEPLLLDDDWYRSKLAKARKIAHREGKELNFSMVTNGTLLTPDRVATLQEYGVRIGLSCDGPPDLNNISRQGGSKVEKAMQLLLKHQALHEVLVVVTPSHVPHIRRTLRYFRESGVPFVRLNFLQPSGRGVNVQRLTAEDMLEVSRATLEVLNEPGPEIVEGSIQYALNRFSMGRRERAPFACRELECQAARTFLAIDEGLDVYACSTDMANHKLGNLKESFDSGHFNQTRQSLHRKDSWYIRCFGCEARKICNFSCPTSHHNDPAFREEECSFTKQLFQYLQTNSYVVRDTQSRFASLDPNNYRFR